MYACCEGIADWWTYMNGNGGILCSIWYNNSEPMWFSFSFSQHYCVHFFLDTHLVLWLLALLTDLSLWSATQWCLPYHLGVQQPCPFEQTSKSYASTLMSVPDLSYPDLTCVTRAKMQYCLACVKSNVVLDFNRGPASRWHLTCTIFKRH